MALSDELSKLAARAKEAEERVAAATNQARAQLEQDVKGAREAAQAQSARLQEAAETDKEKISDWWAGMQKSWSDHVTGIRRNVDAKRGDLETKAAARDADIAEQDAIFAARFALGAVEEAEYAALYATLARMDANSLAENRSDQGRRRSGRVEVAASSPHDHRLRSLRGRRPRRRADEPRRCRQAGP